MYYIPLINREWGHYREISDRGLDVLTERQRGQYIKAEVWDFPVMTERTRLISCLLYGLFSAEKKNGSAFQYPFARARDHSRPCSLNREKPGRAIETRRDSKNSFFENESIFAFITPRSRSNLTLKKFFYNARSAANQSACTIVAI